MELVCTTGNDEIEVKGFDDRIEVYKSKDGGQNWQLIEMLKGPGSRSRVEEIYNSYVEEARS